MQILCVEKLNQLYIYDDALRGSVWWCLGTTPKLQWWAATCQNSVLLCDK